MLNCVQLFRGQSRIFTFGIRVMSTRTVHLAPGQALVINRGTHTTFVKCGNRRVMFVRIITLRRHERLIVHCS
jgi:hypothetical protein